MASNKDDGWEDVPVTAKSSDGWEDVPVEADNAQQGKEEAFWKGVDDDYEQRKPSQGKAASLGFLQGAGRNWADEGLASIESTLGSGSYKDNLARKRQEIYRAQNERPKTFGASEFAGMLGTSPATKNPLTAMGIGATEGVTRSLGEDENITPMSAVKAGLTGTVDGLTAGAFTKYGPKAFDAMQSGAKKVAGPIIDYAKGVAGREAVKGMKPTQDMLKQLNKKGLTEDVGNFALDNKIVNSWRSNKGMNEKAQKVTQEFADQTQPIYEQAKTLNITRDDLIDAIADRQAQLAAEPGKMPVVKKLGKFVKEVEESPIENYNPGGLRNYRQEVSAGLNHNSKPKSQVGGQEMRKLLREKEMGLIESLDPKLRAQNEGLFRNIRLGNEVEKIAERGEAQSGANNLFGLTSQMIGSNIAGGALSGGIVGGTTLATTGDPQAAAIAGGGAMMGREILRRYGNQWTAVAARKIANLASLESFRPMFEKALAKGGSAVPYLHEKLLRENPEYKAQFEGDK